MKVSYRHAVLSDVPEISGLCFEYFPDLDVGMPEAKVSSDAIVTKLMDCIGSGKPPMILACSAGRIVGLYGLELERYWWTDTYHITDYIWYVKPEARFSDIGSGLRKEAEAWAASKGLRFRPTGINISRLEAKDRAFRMAGYSRVGSVYAKL